MQALALPLLTHANASDIVARRLNSAVTAGEFIADVLRVQASLPTGRHLLNACTDRYHFAVALAAAMLAGKITLLPATHTPEMIRQLQANLSDVVCICDHPNNIALPQIPYPLRDEHSPLEPVWPAPLIPAAQTMAWIYTSGSTGTPLAHVKTWGKLVKNVQTCAARFALNDGQVHTLIGTVPPQHMYGLESTVWVALQTGNVLWAGHPFYPEDILQAIQAIPAPRWLVTTPVHLRSFMTALQDADKSAPSLQGIISATAPLSGGLAAQAETQFNTKLYEIYGSTETGQIATRRSAQSLVWQLLDGVNLVKSADPEDSRYWASGGYIEQAVPMNDVIELLGDGYFNLHGRVADLINIAGKRNSLGNLNQQLCQIEGVVDGAFFMPDETNADTEGVTRLTAFVVAPQLSAQQILQALRERIDPVFLPRPLYLVNALPRNTTGKLPRNALQALGEICRAERSQSTPKLDPLCQTFVIPAHHPAFPGHFPGNPIVPGVVLLDNALLVVAQACGATAFTGKIASAKFLSPVIPDERIQIQLVPKTLHQYEFHLTVGERKVATGAVHWSAPMVAQA